MKKLIISTSFGTACTHAITADIDPLEAAYAKAFPDCEIRRAFLSPISRKRLAEAGVIVPSVEESIQEARTEGFDSITIALNLISPGEEYNRLRKTYRDITISKPLLDTTDDFVRLSGLFTRPDDETCVLLMGHGVKGKHNEMYERLSTYLSDGVFVACMDGSPSLAELLPRLLATSKRKILLVPFLLTAVAHVHTDMLGDDNNSWKTILTRAGFTVNGTTSGLGQIPEVQRIFVEKVRASATIGHA